MAGIADAPDLEVCPAGQVDEAISVFLGKRREPDRLLRIDPAAVRPDANHEPVARAHRLQRPWTPSLDRDGVHEVSCRAAAIELRRVFQSAASRSPLKQVSMAA